MHVKANVGNGQGGVAAAGDCDGGVQAVTVMLLLLAAEKVLLRWRQMVGVRAT